MRKLFYVLIISVVMIFGLTFVYKNQQIVTVHYYSSHPWGFSWEGEMAILVIATFVIGMLIGFLLLSLSNVRLRGKLMSSNRKLKKAQSA